MAQWSLVLGQKPKGHWFKPLLFLDVCCALKQGTLSTLSRSNQLILGTSIRWELTCNGLLSYPGGFNDSHPLSWG